MPIHAPREKESVSARNKGMRLAAATMRRRRCPGASRRPSATRVAIAESEPS